MTDEPLVSVLVPTYNHHEFIAESLDSILSQDYENIEIVVSDDASSDGAQEILHAYAARFPQKLHVLLPTERGGVSKNCNRAWERCTGKYVAVMSGDDLMRPGKLRRQVAVMESDPQCAITYHDLEVFSSEDRRTLYLWNQSKHHKPRTGGVADIIIHGTYIGACSSMVRREACPEHGFDEEIPVASDWLFMIESAAGGGTVRFIPEVLGGHRRHSNNVTKIALGLDEQFKTLEIVTSRYPTLARYARKGRGRLYYAKAVESLRAGSNAEARQYIQLSVSHGWISWKSAIRWLQSVW